jgi:hypothetical protein
VNRSCDFCVLFLTPKGLRARARAQARIGWNANGEKTAKKYDELGLDALIGSDKTKGHRTAVGLAHATRKVGLHFSVCVCVGAAVLWCGA